MPFSPQQVEVLIRQLQASVEGGVLGVGPDRNDGRWHAAFGFQAFSGFSLAQYAFRTVTIAHNIGRVPAAYFPFLAPQDAGSSVQIATFQQGSMTPTTMAVTLSNPYNFALTNAQLGWAVLYR